MKREQFIRVTDATRALAGRSKLFALLLELPTYLYMAAYAGVGLFLLLTRDMRLVRFVLVPACVFLAATLLRKAINRPRPYDALDFVPVGKYKKGKGQSMPSRHTASAAAIALACVYVFPYPAVMGLAGGLCLLVAFGRVVKGMHYPSDVLCALLLAAIISLPGYVVV